jgi:NADPH-dependent 2,4-dienoyl-CoA reductase/sulfur reductase-like enzyme
VTSPLSAAAVVVGAGPAGLAAAHALTVRGIHPVLVVERDEAAGGLPRYCSHLGFGWEYARRVETGPRFVARLLGALDPARVRILTRTTVLALRPGPTVEVVGFEEGAATIEAGVVVVATGTRERPRGARLVPGSRPEHGVVTTGQLQQMVARGVPVGGRRAVVVGTEHVSFSALLTARHAGLRVVAMIEPQDRVMSYAGLGVLTRRVAGIPIHLSSRIDAILGGPRPDAVAIDGPAGPHVIPCDTIIFTGDFVPEAPLLRASGVALDARTGGPVVDQYARTSMAGVFAAGNVLRAVESSGFAACEGEHAGACAAAYLGGALGWDGVTSPIALDPGILYLLPQRWDAEAGGRTALPPCQPSLRVATDFPRAGLCLRQGGDVLWQSRPARLLRQRRIRVDLTPLIRRDGSGAAISLSVVQQH